MMECNGIGPYRIDVSIKLDLSHCPRDRNFDRSTRDIRAFRNVRILIRYPLKKISNLPIATAGDPCIDNFSFRKKMRTNQRYRAVDFSPCLILPEGKRALAWGGELFMPTGLTLTLTLTDSG